MRAADHVARGVDGDGRRQMHRQNHLVGRIAERAQPAGGQLGCEECLDLRARKGAQRGLGEPSLGARALTSASLAGVVTGALASSVDPTRVTRVKLQLYSPSHSSVGT